MARTFTPADARRWRAARVDNAAVAQRVARVRKRSIKTESKLKLLHLALSMVDLTTLEGQDTPEKVQALCRKAIHPFVEQPNLPHTAAVCVYPNMVPVAAEAVRGSGVKVAAVATGFPSGQIPAALKVEDDKPFSYYRWSGVCFMKLEKA